MGMVLILGTFVLSKQSMSAEEAAKGTIVSSAPERSYIEAGDSDGDGVDDWQEALAAQVIDAIELPSTTPQTNEGSAYEAPTTFTGKFAEALFTDYLSGKPGGEALGEEEKKKLIANAVTSIQSNTASKIFMLTDIIVVPDSEESLHTYGNDMAEIINRYSIKNENEALILKRALEQSDPKILNELKPIREVYEKILKDSLAVPAPQSIAQSHAALLSSYDAIRIDIGAMEQVFTDPILALARLQKYESDALMLYQNFKSIATVLISKDVSYEKDEPGALIYILDV
jgi:hypothetical protein